MSQHIVHEGARDNRRHSGFSALLGRGVKMLFAIVMAWVIGLFGIYIIWIGLTHGFSTGEKGVMYVIIFIGGVMAFIGVLIFHYFTHKYDTKFTHGYETKTRYIDY